MASSAIKAKLAVMNIVGSMAIVASAAQLSLGVERLAVAGFAVDIVVRAIKWEGGLPVVIKTPFRPVDRRVAEGAVIGEAITVGILRLVARHAICRCVAEPLSFVAGRALGVVVLAE